MQSPHFRMSVLFFVLSVSIASTCASGRTRDINFDDHDRLTPGGRFAYEIYPGTETRRRGSMLDIVTGLTPVQGDPTGGPRVKGATATVAVAGEYATVDGRDDIGVAAGQNIDLGVEIPGPTVAEARVENRRGHVGIRGGGRFWDVLSIEMLLGVGIDDTEADLRSPGFDLTEQQTEVGFASSFRLSVRPIPLFDLYGQATFMLGSFASADLEAGGQLNLTPNLGVYAGYRRWAYDKSSFSGSGSSDLEVRFYGPTVGASLTF